MTHGNLSYSVKKLAESDIFLVAGKKGGVWIDNISLEVTRTHKLASGIESAIFIALLNLINLSSVTLGITNKLFLSVLKKITAVFF